LLTPDSIQCDYDLPKDLPMRRGKFSVAGTLIDAMSPDLMRFLSNFIIVRAEYMYDTKCIEYYAVSKLFDPIDDGTLAPEYTFTLKKYSNGKLDIFTERIDPERGEELLRALRMLDGC